MEAKKPTKAKQVWKPGRTVNVGGRPYVVDHQEETAPKGEARAWVIKTADGSRVYRWRAFRGLELISGQELVRQRVRRKKVAGAHVQPAPAGTDPGLLGVIIEDIRQHPRAGSGEFLTKVLAFFGVSLDAAPPPAKRQKAAAGADGHDAHGAEATR